MSLPTGTVTFLFSDIEGSTRLLTTLGSGYPALLSRHNALVRQEIAASGGVEVKTEGDAFFVAFSGAVAGLQCAARVQQVLAGEPWPPGHEVRVRIGLHTGEGVLSEGDYVGLDVHIAARIAAAAHGGQVVLSEATRASAGATMPAGATLRDLGEHRLKDLPAPLRLHQLLLAGLPDDFPPLRSQGRGSVPEPVDPLIGRDGEVAAVSELLAASRLVTLTGPGGTGKTRLSIEVARRANERFPHGAWFVPLDTVSDPDLVLPAVGRALAVREEPGRPPLDWLAQAIGQRELLVVLDNFEQVAAAAPWVGRLLEAGPGPRFLCTSREALRIRGEQEFPVPPLGPDPATQLFLERARQVRPAFDPQGAELAAVGEICRLLDRLPLAIELAAARIRLFSPTALLARLGDRLGMLDSGGRDLPERQRTLRGAIEWSHELLTAEEGAVFARLAVFAGGAGLDAIEAVVDPLGEVTPDVLAALASLVEKNLVRAADGPAGEPRFDMLETIRDYAAERLAASGASGPLRDRHVAWLLELAERSEADLTGPDPRQAFARLEAEHDNVRAAIEWSIAAGRAASGLRIGGAIWRFWQQRGHLGEGRAVLEALLAAPSSHDDPRSRARGLTAYGGVIYWQGDYAAAGRTYEEALALYRAAGDERGTALTLYDLSFPMAIARRFDEARRLQEESRALYERLGDERGALRVRDGMAAAALVARDLGRARAIADAVVADYRRLGLIFHLADTLSLLAAVCLEEGDAAAARRALGEAVAANRLIGDTSARAGLLQFGALLAAVEGRLTDGARLLGALQAMREAGEPFLTPAEALGLADPEGPIRAALPEERFVAAWEEGRRLPSEAALMLVAG